MTTRAVRFLRLAGVLSLLLLGLLVSAPARGDLIFFKDGFVLEGQVKRESVAEFDKEAKDFIIIPKGFSFYVDDLPRRIYFSHTLVGDPQKKGKDESIRVINKNTPMILGARSLPGLEAVLETGEWNEKWECSYSFRCPNPKNPTNTTVNVNQRLGFLTPYFARADSTKFFGWSACYMTREFGPETTLGLLRVHPDLKDSPTLKPEERAARRFKIGDFLAQAGWYDEAEGEFQAVAKDLPEQKERVETSLKVLSRIRGRERFEEIKRQHQAGQIETVLNRLAAFPEKDVDDKVLAGVAELKSDCETVKKRLQQARGYLADLAQQVGGGNRQTFLDIAAAMRDELIPENLPRLDAFMGQAAQAERLRKEKQPPAAPAENLMSLAVTGWLLGSPSAEANVERTLRLWAARDMVLAALREPVDVRREKLILDYTSRKDAVPMDEVVQLIPTLPPETADKIETKPTEVRVGSPLMGATTYLLQLPPEYRHGRNYPVLIVLHDSGEKPRAMLDRWKQLAADNGYILAAPQWESGLGGSYGYSEKEHATVLLALRDLRRRFSIDSDRVFLFGLGQGANMAYDIGLSHPDQFAGVIPMSGTPELFPFRYWRNAQALPFYVILGDHAGEPNKKTRDYFTTWVLRGFPTIWVQYKGRGMEWFGGEQLNIIDWMRNKKRVFPLHQLGTPGNGGTFGTEFCTMRQIDNRFYWLSTSGLLDRCQNSAGNWNNQIQCATLHAKIDTTNNDIFVRAAGVKQVSVWISRNSRGENMIDLDKPVTVRVELQPVWANKKITPKLTTLLEDQYNTADRQRLYLARIDCVFAQGGWRCLDK